MIKKSIELFTERTIRSLLVGVILLSLGASAGLFLRVENMDARVSSIENTRFTDRDATALETRMRRERQEETRLALAAFTLFSSDPANMARVQRIIDDLQKQLDDHKIEPDSNSRR